MIKGALHVHSTYSDGERTIGELRALFLAEGCRFVAMADHAEAFDESSLRAYLADCERHSDEDFVFVPGLEFGCERRMHILGYGVTSRCATTDPQRVIEFIERARGVSVIAHPRDDAFDWIESFTVLPMGIETWNSKYDGRYAPRARTFRLLHRLQRRRPEMLAFYGQDLHWRKQFHGLFTIADMTDVSPAQVIETLRRGAFHGFRGDLELPSSGALGDEALAAFDRINGRSSRARRFIGVLNRFRQRIGGDIPAPIKAQLRRFF
jgi:hypothetical protein